MELFLSINWGDTGLNFNNKLTKTTRLDTGTGSFLKGNGKGDFTYIANRSTVFFVDKDVANMIK